MATLRIVAAAIALFAAAPASAADVARWRAYVEEASTRFGVPIVWIERVMRAESAGRTTLRGRPITSYVGAMGLMQLMPRTWAEMRRTHGLGSNPHDPRDNILAGTAYLRLMHDRFGYPGLFAAYNAGPARYALHLATGRSLPAETRAYLAQVAGGASRTADLVRPTQSIFLALGSDRADVATTQSGESSGLFFLRRHSEAVPASQGVHN